MRHSLIPIICISLSLVATNTSAIETPVEQSFMESLVNHLSPTERAEWEAYVAKEGVKSITENYYVFGAGACTAITRGTPEKYLVENYAEFFGLARAKAIVAAATEVICPKTKR